MEETDVKIDLSELKDLHIPTEPDFWPLAYGWYVILAALLIFIVLLVVLYKRHQRKPLPYALKELEKIKDAPEENRLKLLSQLLKRVAIVKYDRKDIAPLTEEKWMDFLLATAPKALTKEQAHALAFAIYIQDKPNEALYKNYRNWIKTTLKNHK